MKKRLFALFIIMLSILATIKVTIIGIWGDEEYAVTMACRIVGEDRMFMEMWESHQTSGFLSAFLIWIYMSITGHMDGVIIFLRITGALIQGGISVLIYSVFKKDFGKEVSFVAAAFFFNIMPKWTYVPEFANMLIWFATLSMLCFYHYYCNAGNKTIWLVVGAGAMSLMVLSYPSTILCAPLICVFISKVISKDTAVKHIGIVLGTCFVAAITYVGFFLSHMSISQFIFGLRQMMTDGTHDNLFHKKLTEYPVELFEKLLYIIIPLAVAWLLTKCVKKYNALRFFWMLVVLVTFIMQVMYWLMDTYVIPEPFVFYYLIQIAGICLYRNMRKEGKHTVCHDVLFWFGNMWGLAVWGTALLITNTPLSNIGHYLLPGVLSSILFFGQREDKENGGQVLKFVLVLAMLGTMLYAKGFLVCSFGLAKDNVFYVKQKGLSGPAQNIYMKYSDGYSYNLMAKVMEKYVEEGSAVLYVGENPIYYIMHEQEISNFSTISTPVYDERLLEYWECYPEKFPRYVIADAGEEYDADVMEVLELEEIPIEYNNIEKWAEIRFYKVLGVVE